MDQDIEERALMDLIIHGGNARSLAMSAMQAARERDFEKADELLSNCETELNAAHNGQTDLLQQEAQGNGIKISMLTIHAQDHLMNAITVKDLAKEMVNVYKLLKE